MKLNQFLITLFCGAILFSNSFMTQAKSTIKGEEIIYQTNGINCKGYVAFDEAKKGKRPAIIVVHEWWGCGDYVRHRADMLAELGYIAIAVDLFGEGKFADNPEQAKEYAMPFYQNPELARAGIEAAVEKIKSYPQADAKNIAAIGYCFGGSMVLNVAKMGMDFKGVVSFHGGLSGGVPATKGTTKAQILVCNGAADKFVSADDIKSFQQNLDEMKVSYIFKSYESALHAFTNPIATENGIKFNMPIAYNEAADKQSWIDMKDFLSKIFK